MTRPVTPDPPSDRPLTLCDLGRQVEVMNGSLVCPETGRKFPVTDGIPNMLLNEDEV